MNLVTPDTGLLFWMVVIFGIVFFLLAKFGFPIITDGLRKRNARIQKSLDDAQEIETRMAEWKKEQAEMMEQTRKEQAAILREAAAAKVQIVADARAQAQEEADKILSKPQPLKLPKDNVKLRHYGKLIQELFEKLKTMPEGEERDALTLYTANQMKRDLMTWGHGSMDDEKVANDLAHFTDGIIQLDLNNLKLTNTVAGIEDGSNKKGKKKK